ncbi:MAG: penicillin-binding protein 2 [bacterium]|nr:penicillin-binding protein 2 [bacterium]
MANTTVVVVVILFVVVAAGLVWIQRGGIDSGIKEAEDPPKDIKAGVGESVGVRGDILDRNRQTLASSAEGDSCRRSYPKGRLASHVLGVVNDQGSGLEGLEVALDKELSPSREKGAVKGSSVVLTIDEHIQSVIERELEQAVKSFKAKGGSIVVMDARNADILAMATYPDFVPAEYDKLPKEVRRNRAATDSYSSGSFFSIFLAGVALNNGYTSKSTFDCPGLLDIDGQPVDNANGGSASKKSETLADIMAYSMTGGIASCALELGKEKVGKGVEAFGFGRTVGLEVVDEPECLLPDWRKWSNLKLVDISLQQCVATPLQLASAMQAVANDGVRMRPHLVKEIVSADGETKIETKPEVLGNPLSKESAKELREMLAGVVSYGTGKQARVPGYRVGGKSSTVLVDSNGDAGEKFIAGFLGLAPVDKPEIVVVVKIEEPRPVHYGSFVAAPTFSKVTSQILPLLNVAPTPGYKQVDPATGL